MALKTKTFDIVLALAPVLLLSVGIAVIYSLVFNTDGSDLAWKQLLSAGISIAIMLAVSFADYRLFKGANWIFYFLIVLLLLYVDFFGKAAGGAMRWIDLGFFQLQPSELAKAFLTITLASYFSNKIGKITWGNLFTSFFILLLPLLLVLKEPDLGTGLVLCLIYVAILVSAKLSKTQLICLAGTLFLCSSLLLLSAFSVKPFDKLIHDYQRNRILTFIDPNIDPYGKGYNVRQAQITVGSGGVFGSGLGKGSQSQLRFLPKPHTDFIFSGIAESFGFLGTMTFIGLYAVLVVKIINIAGVARDTFGMMICVGGAAMFLFQVCVNIGMNLGLMPVTGIPLPFASYGGSSLVVYFFVIGLIQSVFIRHKKIAF